MLQKEQYNLLILGLDHAGKTSLLERIKSIYMAGYKALPPSKISTTVGLNIAKVIIGRIKLVLWDLGGQPELHSLWDKYYGECHGLVFVVDSTEESRILQARSVFEETIQHADLDRVPVLLLVNKQDSMDAMQLSDVKEIFNESAPIVGVRDCKILPVSALNGDGVEDGIKWLLRCCQRNVYRPPIVSEIR
eukprot:Nk52_evm10s284 gene=Nk52_evmTU10s284